mgnify:CR=1 FL=1
MSCGRRKADGPRVSVRAARGIVPVAMPMPLSVVRFDDAPEPRIDAPALASAVLDWLRDRPRLDDPDSRAVLDAAARRLPDTAVDEVRGLLQVGRLGPAARTAARSEPIPIRRSRGVA